METLLLVVVAAVAATILWSRAGDRGQRVWVAVVLGLVLGGYGVARLTYEPRAGGSDDPANVQRPLQTRDHGFVSSDACASCHPSEYASWSRSYHRTMTQVITPETMIPEWSGSFVMHGKKYRLFQERDQYWVEVDQGLGTTERRRVLMATGSHLQQVYWVATGKGREVRLLPLTWLVEDERWIPYSYSFLKPDDPEEPLFIWNKRCIFCHSTGGRPRVDETTLQVKTQVGELGIACESCHGPADRHARANRSALRRYRLYLTGEDDDTIVNPAKLSTERSNEICGQCHSMMGYSNDEYVQLAMSVGSTYRPGEDLSETRLLLDRPGPGEQSRWPEFVDFDAFTWDDGQIRNSGRDYNGIVASACGAEGDLTCLDCHSMHQSDPEDQLAHGMAGDEACLQCHDNFRTRIAEHSHHAADSSGSRCYNCHMPHTTYGLLKAIRSHTLGHSPSVRESIETRRPNACNLCHLDRSLGWTGRYLTDWYGQPSVELTPEQGERSAALLWLLRGDALQRALVAWHMGWEEAVRTSGEAWIAPYLALTLDDPYSAVRYIAARSLESLPGYERLDYDFVGPEAERTRVRREVWEQWYQRAHGLEENPALFLGPGGRIEQTPVQDVVRRRDNRRVQIME